MKSKVTMQLRGLSGALFVTFWGLLWLYGIILVKGFGMKVGAFFVVPYAWYVAVRKLCLIFGLL